MLRLSLHETRPAVAPRAAASNDSAERRSALDAVGGYGNHALHSSEQSHWPLGRPAVANQLSAVRIGRVRRAVWSTSTSFRIGDSSWLSRDFREDPGRILILSCLLSAELYVIGRRSEDVQGSWARYERNVHMYSVQGYPSPVQIRAVGRRILHAK